MSSQFDKTCRCCLKEAKKTGLKNLQKDRIGSVVLIDCYKQCSGIEDPSGYKNICLKCAKSLKLAHEFRQLCQESHQKFLEISEKEDVKEEFQVVEVYPETDEIKQEILSDDEEEEEKPAEPMKDVVVKSEEALKNEEKNDSDQEMDDRDVASHMDVDNDDDDDDNEEEEGFGADKKQELNTENCSTMNSYLLKGHFVCDVCDATFENCRDLNSHKKNHIWDLGTKQVKRNCPVCQTFTDCISEHLKKIHTNYKPNTCGQCSSKFQTPCQLRVHLISHVQGVFMCMGCEAKFTTHKQLKSHLGHGKHAKDKYECHECGQVCSVFSEFREHFQASHNEGLALRQFYPCYGCKSVFKTRRLAEKHKCKRVVPVAGPKTLPDVTDPIECRKCGEKFLCEDELDCHQTTWCQVAEFSCQICNLTFKKASYLRSHNDNMHKEKRYICDECGSAWATQLRLKAHITHTHVKVRSFKCGFCDASFKTAGDVKSHEVSHQDRQFQCAHCLKKFRDLSSIRRHVFLHMTMTEATHKCNFCDRTFIQLSDMRSHQRDHTRTSHACTHCDKVYTNSSGLINHVDYHHLNIRYCCNLCGMIYGSKTHLYEHYFSHRGFKPYHCNVCPREEVRKEKMKTHLKGHNVKYDFNLHGYAELDPEINKVIDSCRRRIDTGTIEVQMKPPRVRQVKQEKRTSTAVESASTSWC